MNLCELIHSSCSGNLPAARIRILGLFRCIQVTLLMLRHNLLQELLFDIQAGDTIVTPEGSVPNDTRAWLDTFHDTRERH